MNIYIKHDTINLQFVYSKASFNLTRAVCNVWINNIIILILSSYHANDKHIN